MKTYLFSIGMLLLANLSGCGSNKKSSEEIAQNPQDAISLSIYNSTNMNRVDESVFLAVDDLKAYNSSFNEYAFVLWDSEKEIPSQAIDSDNDGFYESIIFNINIGSYETKELKIKYSSKGRIKKIYKKRTQADLSNKVGGEFVENKYIGGTFKNVEYLKLPNEHTDHSEFIRYEGVGWESDKVGYRSYLDWRNAVDVFGKRTKKMVLQNVGQDGFESYHHLSDWGMDILKVGESLGLGSIATWSDEQTNRVSKTDSVDCSIMENGSLYSQIMIRYFGWDFGGEPIDLASTISISAGSRITKNHISLSNEVSNICTGIAKHEKSKYFTGNYKDGWNYIATYGLQSLAGDKLGLAIFFNTDNLIEYKQDNLNYLVLLSPENKTVEYYYCSAWEKEADGIKSFDAFKKYLDDEIEKMNHPIEIIF